MRPTRTHRIRPAGFLVRPRRHLDAAGRRTQAQPPEAGEWSRNRLLAILAAAAALALTLTSGLVYAGVLALHSSHVADGSSNAGPTHPLRTDQMTSITARSRAWRDKIAAQPMLAVPDGAQDPTTPTTHLAGTITIPTPVASGPAADARTAPGAASSAGGSAEASAGGLNVRTGFPHTPQGAVGQLAALGQTVFGAMSITTAHEVYQRWAMPGGVGAERWRMTLDVASFLGAAGMGPAKSADTTVSVIPAAAQIKGTDGPDWTLACVLFEINATASTQAAIGYGYCERMQWDGPPDSHTGSRNASPASSGRQPGAGPHVGMSAGSVASSGHWMIAPGSAPATAPSTWPGSALALRAGWLTWTTDPTARSIDPTTRRAAPDGVNAPDNPAGDGAGTNGEPADPAPTGGGTR